MPATSSSTTVASVCHACAAAKIALLFLVTIYAHLPRMIFAIQVEHHSGHHMCISEDAPHAQAAAEPGAGKPGKPDLDLLNFEELAIDPASASPTPAAGPSGVPDDATRAPSDYLHRCAV